MPGDAARQARYDEVLSRASLEEMWRPVVPVEGDEANGAERASMGLAFFLERPGGLDFVAHSGGQNGFISHFYVHLPSRTAYIVAFNTLGIRRCPTARATRASWTARFATTWSRTCFPCTQGSRPWALTAPPALRASASPP